MSKLGQASTSALAYDGQIPVVISSGRLSLSTAAANANPFVAPCDLYVEQLTLTVIQAADATSLLDVGTSADVDAILDAYSIATSVAAGTFDIPMSTLASRLINKGDVVEFTTDGASTSAGVVAVCLVCSPRSIGV